MKKIRLEIPLGKEEYLPKKVWLKVNDKRTEAFEDRDFTIPIPIPVKGKKVSFDVEVPNELRLIEIVGVGGTTPDGDISFGWLMDEVNPNWRVPGLKKVTVIFNDRIHEVPVINERPDRKEWDDYRAHECDGFLFLKNWALAVYTLENQTIAAFHWHPNLIKELEAKKRTITLSKGNQLPCMWEKGGQIDKFTGNSTIICDANGNKKKPIFIRGKGTLACSEHALIVIHEGDVIIEVAYQKNQVFMIEVFKIIAINAEECKAELERLGRFSCLYATYDGIEEDIAEKFFSDEKTQKYKDAILKAYAKAMCYHCREPYFIRTE